MRNIIGKYWQWMLTMAFGIVVFLFWFIGYREALSFNEELQLFLFDTDYLIERLSYAGGLSVYIGEFLTQFYTSLTIGSAILAVVFVILQRLVWLLAKREGAEDKHYALSFLPSVFMLYAMGDENILLSMLIAMIFALTGCLLYAKIDGRKWQIAAIVLGVPLILWISCVGAYAFAAYVIIREIRRNGINMSSLGVSAGIVIYTIILMIVAYRISPYPMRLTMGGMIFYRYRYTVRPIIFVILIVYMLTSVAIGIFSAWEKGKSVEKPVKSNKKAPAKQKNPLLRTVVVEVVVLIAAGIAAVWLGYDSKKYDIMEYDLLLRTHQWNTIIEKAEKTPAASPVEVSTINFALAMTGQLAERAFEFYQHGTEGLLPFFKREVTATLMANEIYFRLGFINTGQRFTFEAMELVPNGQKSGRMLRRLVETNLINGEYAVAEKYLKLLDKTYAYRKWAKETRELMQDEQKVNAHPFYGEMRRFRVEEDFYFSDQQTDQMLGLLFVHNKNNTMALEYLLMCELLKKDLPHFIEYYPLTKELVNYNRIPRAYQEALIFEWVQKNNFKNCPWPINEFIKQKMADFGETYTHNPKSKELTEGYNATSVWRYLLFEKI